MSELIGVTVPVVSAAGEGPVDVPRGRWGQAWDRLKGSRVTVACMGVVGMYLVVALCAFTPLFDKKIAEKVGDEYEPPALKMPALWLGTDIQGRSVFWRLLYGTRMALVLVVCVSVLSIGIGVVLGVVSGYFGGWIDDLIIWLFSTISSVPWILLVIAMAYALQSHEGLNKWLGGATTVILALGLTDWVGLCRLIRGEVIRLRDMDFVVAARAVGAGRTRVIVTHILPNVWHIVIIMFSLGAVGYVQAEVVLAFLGLGITQKPSWGRMIDDAKLELLRGVWWQATAATVAILILCLALNLLGDALRDALDPKLHGER